MKRFALLSVLALAACSSSQTATVSTDIATLVADGALFCAKADGLGGTITVMLANAAGVPVSVTNQASAAVAKACALIAAIPVSPPANANGTPIVASATTLPPV